MTTIEAFTLAGWHPDAGVWPLLTVVLGTVGYLLWPVRR